MIASECIQIYFDYFKSEKLRVSEKAETKSGKFPVRDGNFPIPAPIIFEKIKA